MKKYIAFSGTRYQPSGGANDIIGYFDTVEDAITEIEKNTRDWELDFGHVYDTQIGLIVWEDGKPLSNEEITRKLHEKYGVSPDQPTNL